jgi:hypothetical protein
MLTTDNNLDVTSLHRNLKQSLASFPEGMDSLDIQLESSAKHIPAYVKIVKSHIEQLQRVLQLPNHEHKTLESVGLAKSVQQLMEIFTKLEADDLTIIEDLAIVAKTWQTEDESTFKTTVKSSETITSN